MAHDGRCSYSGLRWFSFVGVIVVLLFDVVFSGNFIFSLLVCPVWFLIALARAVSRGSEWKVGIRNCLIPAVTFAIVVGNANLQSVIAKYNAHRIIDACQRYVTANGTYPERLDSLVPRYMPSIPSAKYCLDESGTFQYQGGDFPILIGGGVGLAPGFYFLNELRGDALLKRELEAKAKGPTRPKVPDRLSLGNDYPFGPQVQFFIYDPDLDRMLVREGYSYRPATTDWVQYALQKMDTARQFNAVMSVLHPQWEHNRLGADQIREIIRRLKAGLGPSDLAILSEKVVPVSLSDEPFFKDGFWQFTFAMIERASVVEYTYTIDGKHKVKQVRTVLIGGPDSSAPRDALPPGAMERARAFLNCWSGSRNGDAAGESKRGRGDGCPSQKLCRHEDGDEIGCWRANWGAVCSLSRNFQMEDFIVGA